MTWSARWSTPRSTATADDDSLIHESLLILIGGDETTRHVLSGGMLAPPEHPGQLERLRADPGLLPVAVEEMLRWESPIKDMVRTTASRSSCTARGSRWCGRSCRYIPRRTGTRRSSTGRDVRRGADAQSSLAFGFGAHFCLGNELARVELL